MAKILKIYVTDGTTGEEELVYPLSISNAIIHTTNNKTVLEVLDDLSGSVNYLKTTTYSGIVIDSISKEEIKLILEGTYKDDDGGW